MHSSTTSTSRSPQGRLLADGTAGIEEADMIMVCKKMYHDEIKPECFDAGENDGKWYPQKDYHLSLIHIYMCIRDRYGMVG